MMPVVARSYAAPFFYRNAVARLNPPHDPCPDRFQDPNAPPDAQLRTRAHLPAQDRPGCAATRLVCPGLPGCHRAPSASLQTRGGIAVLEFVRFSNPSEHIQRFSARAGKNVDCTRGW